jgi:hypothetical protein
MRNHPSINDSGNIISVIHNTTSSLSIWRIHVVNEEMLPLRSNLSHQVYESDGLFCRLHSEDIAITRLVNLFMIVTNFIQVVDFTTICTYYMQLKIFTYPLQRHKWSMELPRYFHSHMLQLAFCLHRHHLKTHLHIAYMNK